MPYYKNNYNQLYINLNKLIDNLLLNNCKTN